MLSHGVMGMFMGSRKVGGGTEVKSQAEQRLG